jgi:hypothetical protein
MWHAVHLHGRHLSLTAARFLEFLVRAGAARGLAPVGRPPAKKPAR